MKQQIYDRISDNPIIAAVKDDTGLKKCLDFSDVNVVFVLYGRISTIGDIVSTLKKAGKTVIVHMDLISGLNSKEDAVDFIAKYTNADGIISTRLEQIKRGRELSLCTIFRIFLLDSKVLDNINNRQITEYADAVEILPGLMPKIISKMSKTLSIPLIAGGLISDKEDVINALNAGAFAISSTNSNVWKM